MIDNIKIFVIEKYRLENHIKDNNLIDLSSKVSILTGEVSEYPKKGKDLNLDVSINLQSASILGSLHKYKNLLEDRGSHNFDDFNFCQIQDVISGLIKKYSLEKTTKITNLEFGFNLAVSKDPRIIIDNNLLMNNCKAPNKNLKYSGKGDYKEFESTDYKIKIYNKSKQYKQYKLETHILRVEMKIILKRLLEKLEINCIEDLLEKGALAKLFVLFMQKFEGLNIVDNYDPEAIPEKDSNKLDRYTNPIFWIRIKEDKSDKVASRLKRDFNTLLIKHDLLKTKNEIRKKLEFKFVELLDSECKRDMA